MSDHVPDATKMAAFLEWLDKRGLFDTLLELGLGLFCLISLVRCSLE